jgi:hypothetical protein
MPKPQIETSFAPSAAARPQPSLERPAQTRPVSAANHRILGIRARAFVRALDSRIGPCLSPRLSDQWDDAVEDMLTRRERALRFTITRYAENYRRRAVPSSEATRHFRAEIERALGVAAWTANGVFVIATAVGWLVEQGL